jgi:hypothetical protein
VRFDGLEVLFGDDHVGIDIDHLERRGDAFQRGEFFHERGSQALVPLRFMMPGAFCQVPSRGRRPAAVLIA